MNVRQSQDPVSLNGRSRITLQLDHPIPLKFRPKIPWRVLYFFRDRILARDCVILARQLYYRHSHSRRILPRTHFRIHCRIARCTLGTTGFGSQGEANEIGTATYRIKRLLHIFIFELKGFCHEKCLDLGTAALTTFRPKSLHAALVYAYP